jgi:hypothetical protein
MERNAPEELEISCEALGVVGCTRRFRGETAGDIVDAARDHLRSEHDIDLPETEVILQSSESLDAEVFVDRFMNMGYSKRAVLVMRRLRELLNVQTPSEDEPRV